MAIGTLYSEVEQTVINPCRVSEKGEYSHREGIAADAGEVLPQQIGCPFCLTGAGCADHFDVVTLPVHQSCTGSLRHPSAQGLQVCDSQPEACVGVDRPQKCNRGFSAVDGSYRQRGDRSVISRSASRWLHDPRCEGID
jgi:hypothetical protein